MLLVAVVAAACGIAHAEIGDEIVRCGLEYCFVFLLKVDPVYFHMV